MVAIPLTSGAYQSETYIASAQRAINLFTEKNPEETTPKFPTTQYVRPGLLLQGTPPQLVAGRCIYGATNGDLYAVIGQGIFYINPDNAFNQIGSVISDLTTPCYMADNGTNILLVDGSSYGYQIN